MWDSYMHPISRTIADCPLSGNPNGTCYVRHEAAADCPLIHCWKNRQFWGENGKSGLVRPTMFSVVRSMTCDDPLRAAL